MTPSQSTIEKGDGFRDAVAAILRTKYPDTQTEVRLGSKKVDIVFTRQEFGSVVTFGVECKDYGRPLTKELIKTEIFSDYHPLVDGRLLDRVIIVASKDISADARAYVDGVRWLSHQTLRQLEEDLLGLREYIESLSRLFENESRLSSYYVEARLVGEGSATTYIDRWLAKDASAPLAIMGGYGKGKTSFALRVISEQAKRYLADPTARMPVLIRLGQVVHETQLEGLFGKEFTARQPANDFKFQTLEYLNEHGRLFIVLDGFDEMKHAMSASDFRANFREFNRLLRPNAKVLMLGRPNALPTEARQLVFRGIREYTADTTVIDPHFRAWTETEIDFFNDTEIDAFLRAYLAHLLSDMKTGDPTTFIEHRTAEVRREVDRDLLRRPVHAKIVAELASDASFDLRGFTQHTLYAQFMQRLIERDVDEKQARRDIGVSDRLAFQRELAWWSWTKPGEGQGFFDRDQVPRTLLDGLPNGRATDPETKLAEYLVSTLTEEKEAGVLYFAHRSFQEFLVAERIRRWTPSADQHMLLASGLTVDVREFLDAAPDCAHVRAWYETLGACPSPLPVAYLKYFKIDKALLREIADKAPEQLSVADVAILGLRRTSERDAEISPAELTALLADTISVGREDAAVTAIACLVRLRFEEGSLGAIQALAVSLVVRVIQRMKEAEGLERGLFIPSGQFGAPERMLAGAVTKKADKVMGRTVTVNLRELLGMAAKHLTIDAPLIARGADVQQAAIVGIEFTNGPRDPSLGEPVTLPVNHLLNLIEDKGIKKSAERVVRLPGARFEVIELKERGKTTEERRRSMFKIARGIGEKRT